MRQQNKSGLLVVLYSALLAVFVLCTDQFVLAAFTSTSTSFKSTDQNISDIGGNTISTSFTLYQNVGQVSVGESSSTNFKIRAGVLYWDGQGAATPTPTPTPGTTIITGSGGGGGSGVLITPTPGVPDSSEVPPSINPGVPGLFAVCDFNKDGFCNIVDLSILLYWYGKTGREIMPYDLNKDNSIDLKDISVLFYHWKE